MGEQMTTAIGDFTVTGAWIDQVRTKNGGWTKRQLAILGVQWPPKHGWKRTVIGKGITQAERSALETNYLHGFKCQECGTWYADDFSRDSTCHDCSHSGKPECLGALVPVVEKLPDLVQRFSQKDNSMRLKTELFKNGDAMAIRTNATNEAEFIQSVAQGLNELIETGRYVHDWEFQLTRWLTQTVEIACKLRGYKADVDEQRVITAGDVNPASADRVGVVGENVEAVV